MFYIRLRQVTYTLLHELSRIQTANIGTFGLAIENELRNQLSGPRAILNTYDTLAASLPMWIGAQRTPTCMPCSQ